MFESVKKFFWKLIEPFFPTIRDIWVGLGFMEHNRRQLYHLGRIKPEFSDQDLRQYLNQAGFINDYLAWVDPDEVVNMRKIVFGPIHPTTAEANSFINNNEAGPRKISQDITPKQTPKPPTGGVGDIIDNKIKSPSPKGVEVYQYHIRLFSDGELRGHYEFTAESHPFKHLFERGMTSGADYLKPLLRPLLQAAPSPAKSDSKLLQPHCAAGHKADNDANQ